MTEASPLEQIGTGSPGGRGRAVGQQCCGDCNCREASHQLRDSQRGRCLSTIDGRPCDCPHYQQPYTACTWPDCQAQFTGLHAAQAWNALQDHLDRDHPLCRPSEAPAWLRRHPGWRPRRTYRSRVAS
jgi:hypothetical protein